MKKNLRIQIRTVQVQNDGEQEIIETNAIGQYYLKNGGHYVVFEEKQEDSTEPVKSIMKFSEKRLVISKSGAIHTTMEFEKGIRSVSSYRTPYGTMLLGIRTDNYELHETETRISLQIAYQLEANDEHLAECNIHIEMENIE